MFNHRCMDLQVLYEDNHLIAVYKPAGVLVQADDTQDSTLMDEVKYYLKQKYHKTGKVFLGLLHRLDRPVSGVILFAKTSKGGSRLSEQMRKHEVTKVYNAIVLGEPKNKRGVLVNYLVKDENKNRTTVYDREVSGSQYAELSYTTLKTNKKYSLLEVQLKTGRSHQIRSQLSHMGNPIVGDLKYGAPEPLPDKSLALSAVSLTFEQATGDESVTVTADRPEVWNRYLSS